MNTSPLTKSNFIKFNVSPEFKIMTEKKAREHGMTVSELGRMLFGAFVTGIAKPSFDVSPEFLAMAEEAKQDYKEGKALSFSSTNDLLHYLDSTK